MVVPGLGICDWKGPLGSLSPFPCSHRQPCYIIPFINESSSILQLAKLFVPPSLRCFSRTSQFICICSCANISVKYLFSLPVVFINCNHIRSQPLFFAEKPKLFWLSSEDRSSNPLIFLSSPSLYLCQFELICLEFGYQNGLLKLYRTSRQCICRSFSKGFFFLSSVGEISIQGLQYILYYL